MIVQRERQGSVLVQAALLIVGMMGIATLVIDLGIVRATQGSMVVATDVACLEGLRGRDALGAPTAMTDAARRASAARYASRIYDDDGVLSTQNSALQLGAGPLMETGVDRVSDAAGGLLIAKGSYVPDLQLNSDLNEEYGDLVAGDFFNDVGTEDANYDRSDFFHSTTVTEALSANAFLARMRRTHDPLGLDQKAGVSSSGPALPFLFGLGTALGASDPDAYDPRRDGLTVRSTSIADSRLVVAAGYALKASDGEPAIDGVIRLWTSNEDEFARILAFDEALWRAAVSVGADFTISVSRFGAITGGPTGTTSSALGYAPFSESMVGVGDDSVVDSFDSLGGLYFQADSDEMIGTRYAALFSEFPGGARVTGFAAVSIVTAVANVDADGAPTWTLTGVKLGSLVARENASAVPSLATDLSFVSTDPDLQLLRAPVLVR